MSLQWINGIKPPGVKDDHVLVIGPEDFDDEKLVRSALDGYTLRMDSVRVLINSVGNCGAFRPKGFTYQGVAKFAYEWASKNFWPLEIHDPSWWKGKRDKMNAAILEKLLVDGRRHAHCLAFWDGDCDDTAELMEAAREVVPMKNFKCKRV